MPEGDTIHRAAGTLDRALAGRQLTNISSAYPMIIRLEETAEPLSGRTIEKVFPRGKHLIIQFSGDLCLRTHMRMSGSWHLYRKGERWRRSRSAARIVLETEEWTAVGFSIPDASLGPCREIGKQAVSPEVDLLSDSYDEEASIAVMKSLEGRAIGEVLLDQRVAGGVGNVYKSETMFLGSVHPFTLVRDLDESDLRKLLRVARELLQRNVDPARQDGGIRTTLHSLDPSNRLWVYRRKGKPCLRCGHVILMKRQGPGARSSYWCPNCQRLKN